MSYSGLGSPSLRHTEVGPAPPTLARSVAGSQRDGEAEPATLNRVKFEEKRHKTLSLRSVAGSRRGPSQARHRPRFSLAFPGPTRNEGPACAGGGLSCCSGSCESPARDGAARAGPSAAGGECTETASTGPPGGDPSRSHGSHGSRRSASRRLPARAGRPVDSTFAGRTRCLPGHLAVPATGSGPRGPRV
jgi:hypothetical protein